MTGCNFGVMGARELILELLNNFLLEIDVVVVVVCRDLIFFFGV